jgi:glycosyltransferase involved in cell wall biosynthesis
LYPPGQRLQLKINLFGACRRASAIIVPSNYVAAQIGKWRRDRVAVIPHGVRPLGKALTAERKPEEKYFVVLGRIEKKKNLGVVVDAFGKFCETHSGHKLYFIGRFANGADEIVSRAQNSPAVKNIEFLGAVPDAETFALVADAEALLHPCPYEGFGLPAIEAMALGTPVIAAAAGAVAEAVGDAGLLVPPDDPAKWAEAMDQITFDIFRKTLIEKGKRRAAEFTWEKCAAETWKVLLGLTP